MLEYLSKSLTTVEGLFPGCGIILAGDFNRLDIEPISRQFQLKQLVHLPTRGTNTLHLVLTNLHSFCPINAAVLHQPFGFSDHCNITLHPKQREPKPNKKKLIYKRDTRPSHKRVFGRYLSQIDWGYLALDISAEEKNNFLAEIITSGLDYIMPEKAVLVHCNDAPWINNDLKRLIKRRQQAFSLRIVISFKFYRNKVNRVRKACRSRFYALKVDHLKQANPKERWRELKRICGMNSISSTTNLFSHLQIKNIDNLLPSELENLINDSFLEPMKEFCALNEMDLECQLIQCQTQLIHEPQI